MARQLLRLVGLALGGGVGVSAGAASFDLYHAQEAAKAAAAKAAAAARDRKRTNADYAASELRLALLSEERHLKASALEEAAAKVRGAEDALASALDSYSRRLMLLSEHDKEAHLCFDAAAAQLGLLERASERLAVLEAETLASRSAAAAAKAAFPLPLSWR